ncbi:MAG TPA: protein kinase [Pyrinomonadaceae bacterium]|nr:protein kinase [Pyrinomonadaceae bacterium]
MKQPNWDRIQEIYHAALAKPRSEWGVFVAQACANDADLLLEVCSLLKADDSSSGFLESPIIKLALAPENLVGTTIDERYLIERELGSGGMSQVYVALDLKLKRQAVVIKILSETLVHDSYARQKFDQEVEALSRIDHPGVVRVSDVGQLPDERPFIVMQYVDGETLRSKIPAEGMDLNRVASILKQIGAALEHVHEKGIFHRDLKPENIIVKRDTDSVVLLDFGIAKVKDSVVAPSTAHGGSVGTLLYMSPEQLRGEGVTAASDIYSMSLIAYELITGRRPFNPTSASQLLEMQRAGVRVKPVHLREDLSGRAQAIILRALSFDPKARYTNVREFGNRLAHTLLDPRIRSTNKRWPVVNRASVLMLVCVALGTIGLYKYLRKPPIATPTNTFNYWLTVQKMRDGKEYQEPFKSNGEETFENGDKFRLNVSSPNPGYLYVINEGPPALDSTSFVMIYPSKALNNGSATLGANQPVQSDWTIFRGPAGAENFWIVWSASPVKQMESAKNQALRSLNGGLDDQNLVTLKEFLRMKQDEVKVRVTHYKASQTVLVRGPGDVLVTLAQFNHR